MASALLLLKLLAGMRTFVLNDFGQSDGIEEQTKQGTGWAKQCGYQFLVSLKFKFFREFIVFHWITM